MAMMVRITIPATATIRHTSAIAPITITVLGKQSRNPGPPASPGLGAIGKREFRRRERCVRVAPAYVVSLNLKRCRRQEWQDSWLEPGRHRRIFDGCSIRDQLS